MQRKRVTLLLLSVLVLVWSAAVFGAAKPRYRGVDPARAVDLLKIAGDPAVETGSVSSSRTFGTPVSVGASASPMVVPGTRVGETAYDYQHNGSTGRQLDKFGNVIQVLWMKGNDFTLGNRQVNWNKVSVTGGLTPVLLNNGSTVNALQLGTPQSPEGVTALTGGNRPGYVTFRNMPDGRGIATPHDAPETGGGAYWIAAVDPAPAIGVFIVNNAPQPAGIASGAEVIWPKSATDVVSGAQILHVVARGSGDATYDPMYYWRGTVSGTGVTWTTPVRMDSLTTISCVVEQDPGSDKVAIVYAKPRVLTSQTNNDIAYYESVDGGLNWVGPINVTNYDSLSLDRAYTDVAALYDEQGTLHIIWNTLENRPDEDVRYRSLVDIWHWNSVRNTGRIINTIDVSGAGNSCSQTDPFGGGAWNLVMAKPNIVEKPTNAGGIAPELLYAVWVQFGPTLTDCATQDSSATLGGYVNAEIWYSVSSDKGLTWDRPVNITGTETPNCTAGNCHSEHWVSAARLADSALYLSYTDDSHAGGIVQDEGVWTFSPYRVYAIESRLPVAEPRISVGPTTFLELNVAPGASDTRMITVNNVGNADLTYDVVVTNDNGGATHVLVDGGGSANGTILSAGDPDVLTITFDGIGLPNPSEHDWRLEVTSNDATNNEPSEAISINLNVFVADPWFTCTSDTISTGLHRLSVNSCLKLGNQDLGGGLFTYADSSEYIYDVSPAVARLDGLTKVAYRDVAWSDLADRSRDSNQAFRAQSAITVNRNTTVNGKAADRASGIATTTDSLIQIDWEAIAFKDPELADGAVAVYTLTNRTATTFTDLILGVAGDLDVDSLSGANVGIANDAAQYIGAQGGYIDSVSELFVPQSNFAAVFNIPLDDSCTSTAVGGQVLDNADYLYPSKGGGPTNSGYNTDTLYTVMSTSVGWNSMTLRADSVTDVNVVMTISQGNTLTPAGSLQFAMGMAVSSISENDLKSKIAKLKNAVNNACIAGCPITLTGDVNLSGTITSADIIGLVNFVFKGGNAPLPCTASGDVNCSGTVTSADIIGLVNFVFKGGTAPCDACGSPLAAGC